MINAIHHSLDALSPLIFLVAGVLALAIGPLLYLLATRVRALMWSIEGFVIVAVGGLILFDVLPRSLAVGGWLAAVVAAIGLAAPYLLERSRSRLIGGAHALAYSLAGLALVGHAMVDGAAFGGGVGAARVPLSLAVILHRLPVGMAVWWLIRPSYGRAKALGLLIALVAATIGGFFLSEELFMRLPAVGTALFQALVAGSLLHVLLHRHGPTLPIDAARRAVRFEALGAFIAMGFLTAMAAAPHVHGPSLGRPLAVEAAAEQDHDHGAHAHAEPRADEHEGHEHGAQEHTVHEHGAVPSAFVSLALASAPALLLGFALAGLFGVFLPRSSFRWLRGGGSLGQAAKGMAFGLPLPICSCGVVPIYRSLVAQGVPASAAMAFLIATPELGVEALILSVPLLGGALTAARFTSAFAVALLIGWLVGRRVPAAALAAEEPSAEDAARGGWARLARALRIGFVDLVVETGPWLLIGLLIAALITPLGLSELRDGLPPGVDVVIFALIGMPVYICASGSTPLAAVLIASGLSPGAGIAFLLTGPATNVTTFGVLKDLHGKRTALGFAVGVALLAVASGLAVNALFPASWAPVDHGVASEHAHGPLAWLSLGLLSLAFAGALLRVGPRAFLGRVFAGGGPPDEAACCDCDAKEGCGCGGHDGHGQGHDHEHEHEDHARADRAPAESSDCGCGGSR